MLKHKELIMNLECKHPPRDAEEVEHFIAFLIRRVDMTIAKAPTIPKNPMGYYCDIAGNEGVTGIGILETSSTVIHCWDSAFPARFNFNLYSCKDFEVEYVVNLCDSFDILSGSYMVIDRDNTLKLIDHGLITAGGNIQSHANGSDMAEVA